MAYSRQPNVTIAGRGLTQNPAPLPVAPAGIIQVGYDSNIATTTSLGIVQIGEGIDITPEGVISVSGSSSGCNTILVGEDYESESDDCYIGVNSIGPVTISLPVDISNGHQIVIKAEMGAPMGNRKVTVKTLDGSKIDSSSSVILSVPYSCLHLIYRGLSWHIISLDKND